MTTTFKYPRSLKFTELHYYWYGQEVFTQYFNGFLEEFKLVFNDSEEKNFANCINFLNSISYSMVERFLCAYHLYYQNGQPEIMDRFDFYNTNILEEFERKSLTIGGLCTLTSKARAMYNIAEDDIILSVKLNKNGIFYNYIGNEWWPFSYMRDPEDNKRGFINVKDLGEYLSKCKKDLNKKEIKELKSFHKTIIGKPIEKSYELC